MGQLLHKTDQAVADRITLEVIRHQLVSIPNQIERNIERTAFSPLVYEYKDYAVGIVDAEGRLVAQSKGSLPIFVANALGTAVREGLSVLGEDEIGDDDIIITNNPAWLGQHLNNVVAYTPLRHQGKLLGFFCVLVHWVDIGGIVPGSCASLSTRDIWQEGVQLPTVKLIENGARREDIFRIIAANTRFPKLLLGDLDAQLGGCYSGSKEFRAIVERYGNEAVLEAIELMWHNSETAVAEALSNAPEGVYTAMTTLDGNPTVGDGTVPVKISVTIKDGRLTVDFTEIGEKVVGPFNAGRNGGAIAAARIACKYMLAPNTPVNEGDFTRLDVIIPDGKFLSAPSDAAIGHSGTTIPSVVDTILQAMAQAFPDRAAAGHHGVYGVQAFSGRLPDSGERYQHVDTASGGWGARADTDGAGPLRSNGHGDVPDVPVEMQEVFYPFRIEARRLIPDSGGPGRFRGGLGVEKVCYIDWPCQFGAAFDRVHSPPAGLQGGGTGLPGGVEIQRADGTTETFTKGERNLAAGDRVIVRSGGGGGFAPAWNRPVEDVLNDVRFGYVSREAAALHYGVLIAADLTVDNVATDQRRAELAKQAA